MVVHTDPVLRAARKVVMPTVRDGRGSRMAASTLNLALARLNSEAGLDRFLAEVALELLLRARATELVLLTYDAATHRLTLKLHRNGRRARFGPSGDELPLFAAPFGADITPAFAFLARERRIFTPAMSALPPEQFAWPGAMDHLQRINASDATAIGLHVGDEVVGTLHLHFTDGRRLTPGDEPSLIEAADTMAVAMKFWTVAEQARLTALAVERERAAELRAAEMAKANQALQRSSARLTGGSLERFLESVVAEACHATGADNGAVFLLEPAGERFALRMTLFIEAGRAIRIGDDARFKLWSNAAPATADVEAWNKMVRGEVTIDQIPDAAPNLWPPSVPWHQTMGHRTVACAPMRIAERLIGLMGYGFKVRRDLPAHAREALLALAHQASVAVHLTGLAEESQRAAVAREREAAALARAEELGRTNAALRRGLVAVSQSSGLDESLERVFREIVAAAGACVGALFEYDAATHRLDWILSDDCGQVQPHCPDDAPAYFRAPFDADLSPAFAMCIAMPSMVSVQDHHAIAPETLALTWPGIIDWHLSRGHASSCALPVMVGSQPIGVVGLAWRGPINFSEAQQELLFALASQAALVMRMRQLATAEKTAALAQEHEAAALARATELAKANAAIRRTLDILASDASIDALIGHVLVALGEAFGSRQVEYWYHLHGERAYLGKMAFDGEVYGIEAVRRLHPDHVGLDGLCVPPDLINGESVYSRRTYFVVEDWSRDGRLPLALKSAGMFTGLLKELNVPMTIGGHCIGALVIRLPVGTPLSDEKIELAQALAHQATLAVHLSELAEQSRRSAVLAEQEAAAQTRTAELAKANAAIRRTLDILASDTSIDALIGHVLIALGEAFGSRQVDYWYHGDRDRAFVGMVVLDGQVHDRESIQRLHPAHAGLVGVRVPPSLIGSESLGGRQKHYVVEDWRDDDRLPLVVKNSLSVADLHKVLNVPMIIGGRCIGALIVRLPVGTPLSDERIELAQALAHQATLAVHLSTLAEQAKQSAAREERNRLAGEIHDNLAQSFTAIAMQSAALAAGVEADSRVGRTIRVIEQTARLGLAEARSSVLALTPLDQAAGALEAALRRLCERSNISGAFDCAFTCAGMVRPIGSVQAEAALRVAQEAISNALRHSGGTGLSVTLTYLCGATRLEVRDNGRGLTPQHDANNGSGFGLNGMRSRAAAAGGSLTIGSTPGQGTVVTLDLRHPADGKDARR